MSSVDLSDEFQLDDGMIHLNHAGVGPWPRRTVEAVARFADENLRLGSSRYAEWLGVERRLRDRLARLMNAPSADDIALLKNTSEAISVVAYGLDWRAGDNVVFPIQEFPSNRIPWESLRALGVDPRPVDINAENLSAEEAMLERCDARTRILAVSAVQYGNGFRMDIERLGRECRARGILFSVDAIQQLGVLPFDVVAANVDFAMADGHKWLVGPEGVAAFYVRDEVRESLRLLQYGWHMVESAGDYDSLDWRVAGSSRRFECGSPNMLGIHAMDASASLLEAIGIRNISDMVSRKISYITDIIDNNNGLELLSSRSEERRSGIVCFRRAGMDQGRLYQALMSGKVLCALRGGGIRFSPHFYTPEDSIAQALERVLTYEEA